MASIELRKVSKAFGATAVLKDVDLSIEEGAFLVLVGPSGCGKSTLLRVLAGLEEVDSGDIFIGDARVNDLPPAKRGIAMVFQSYALYPHMTVRENMAFGLRLAGESKAAIDAAVGKAAALLEIEPLLERRPKMLSGGQRQRVAIGRAIVREPTVFLFDEPLSNLDAELRVRMRYEFARLHQRLETTTVYVTHDQVEAMTLADRIVVLNAGKIEQVGSPLELYEHPENLFVAGFIGSPRMNFLAAQAAGNGAGGIAVKGGSGLEISATAAASGLRPGDRTTIGIRPEHLRIADPADARLVGEVQIAEQLGGETFVYVALPSGEPLVVEIQGQSSHMPGERIGIDFEESAYHVFDGEGRAVPRPAIHSTRGGAPS